MFVGVAGGSGSGKSTLTHALVDRHPHVFSVVQHDAYYRRLSDEERANVSAHNFDHPDALETDRLCADLDALARGHRIRVPRYDFATHTRRPEAEWDEVTPIRFILVEGLLVFAVPSLRRRLDRKVFVEAPEEVRVRRRLTRDGASRGRSEASGRTQLERTVLPMHRQFVEPSKVYADLLLDGTEPVAETRALMERLLGFEQTAEKGAV